jgi:hypothetical protein
VIRKLLEKAGYDKVKKDCLKDFFNNDKEGSK